MELETKFNNPEYEMEQTYDTLTLERTETTSSIQNVGKPSAHLKKRIFVIVAVIAVFIAVAASVSAFGVSFASKESTPQSAFISGSKLCPLDTLDLNLLITVDSTPVAGDTMTVTCKNNTKLAGPSKIICLSTGSWSDNPKCEKVTCPKLNIPENAIVDEVQEQEIGSVVPFSCREGFILIGNTSVTCLTDGNWSSLPHCEPVDCGNPPVISNGQISNITGTSFNSSFQVMCNDGFGIIDSNSGMFCNKFGVWEGLPLCSVISCSLPEIPEHGFIRSIDGLEYQAKAYLGCFEGYSLTGNNTISCLENGTWSVSPHCAIKGCGFPKPIKHGVIHMTTNPDIGSRVTITCEEGFVQSGPIFITCNHDGLWTEAPKCLPVPCGELKLPTNTYLLQIDGTTFNSTARVRCGNFEVNVSVLVTCTKTGKWSSFPYCGCEVPWNVTNGQIVNVTSTDINGTFVVACDEGSILSGPHEVLCDANGTWTEYPTCEIVSCGEFVPNNNSVILKDTGTTFNSTVQVQCISSNNTNVVICQSNGKWSEQPNCGSNSDCLALRNSGETRSGIYNIKLWKTKKEIKVYCDMLTDGGGCTVFQNRFDGSVQFNRTFSEYQIGFGSLGGEFWLGLSYVQELTDTANGPSELRLDLSAANGSTAYEVFQNFYLSEGINYTLNIGPCVGTAGDSMGLSYNKGWGFSTYDRDIDSHSTDNCAAILDGGWWYQWCTYVNLNGKYATPGEGNNAENIVYYNFDGWKSLKTSKMMFRRDDKQI